MKIEQNSNRQTLHAHFLRNLSEQTHSLLQEQLDAAVTLTTGDSLPQGAAVHVLIAGQPEKAQLEACPELKMVIVPWAGVPEETRELLYGFPHITLHNLHHNAAPTAETALALLLAAARFIVPYDRALRSGRWSLASRENPSILLQGKTALILGYGEIGRRVGQVCRALSMEVLAVRRRVPREGVVEDGVQVYPQDALPDLLPRAHVLVITLPLTPQTRGMVGECELSRMPQDGILVNVGRGPVVDQAALFRALAGGRLAAAGLDVWYNYPDDDDRPTAPADFPFDELENVVLSPHRGGGGRPKEIERLRMSALARLLNAAARGEPVPNQVDLEAGY